MKKATSTIREDIRLGVFICFLAIGGMSFAQQDLLPDQNPNYKNSMDKYMANKDELTKNQGITLQATYKAIDDMQIKQERKDLRRAYRQERRLARINNRRYFYSLPFYNDFNLGFGNNYPYYNNFNMGCNNFPPYSIYRPYNSVYNSCGFNVRANSPLLGLGLSWGLR